MNELRRCEQTSGSSGRAGRTEDGGGLGAIIDSLKARLVTESRKDDLDMGPGSEYGTSCSGAGGSEDVGAGRGGGIEDLLR